MASLKVLIPEATINYVTNPSLRYDTTGWNAQGSTITRVLDYARFGIASLKVLTAGSAVREGTYFRVSSLAGVSEAITISVYVRGTGEIRIRLDNNVIGGTEYVSQTVILNANRWKRVEITGFSTGGNDMRLYVETDEGAAVVRTFYVDGAQMERKIYATTYCDGDQEGCRWNGVYHGATSQRLDDTRAGGKWVQLAGPDREAEDLYMTVAGGLGMASLRNNTQDFALAPGGYFQNKKVLQRLMTMTFFAKHVVEGTDTPVSLAALHQLRQLLINLVKPDRTGGDEDIWFEYEDGTLPIYFQARYDGGLEGEWDIRNQFVNSFPLRLLAVSPLVVEDNQVMATIDFQNSLSANFVLGRVNGTWTNLNSGFNNDPAAGVIGPKGQIYMAGDFSVVNNAAGAVDPLRTGRVVYWDGEKWVPIATTLGGNAAVNGIAVAPNGDVYICGDFTSVNGVAANYIAKYTQSTGLWTALGTGLNALARVVKIAPNGDVYCGGDFTTAGGVSCVRIARWDGLQWRRLGQYGGLNGPVYSLAITRDGTTLYAGGDFNQENGISSGPTDLNNIAEYNISTGLFIRMAEGLTTSIAATDRVYTIFISDSEIVYAGGHFTRSGTTVLQNIAEWNGLAWQGLGSGLGSGIGGGLGEPVRDIASFSNGQLIAVGEFNSSGTLSLSKIALWNGSVWTVFDEYFNAIATQGIPVALIDQRTDSLYLGLSINSPTEVLFSGLTTVNNVGTAEVLPHLYILGPAKLKWLENQTTKKRVYLNLDIQSNEEIFISIPKGEIISTVRGDLAYTLLAGSDFRSFNLRPGDNIIAAFMTNDVEAKMQLYFTPRHWSVDATQNVDLL